MKDWLYNIHVRGDSRILELLTEEKLDAQATDLLKTYTTAFISEQYVDNYHTRICRFSSQTADY